MGGYLMIIIFNIFDHVFNAITSSLVEAGKDAVRDVTHKVMEEAIEKGVHDAGRAISLEMLKSNPAKLSNEVIKLAQHNNGELTEALLMTEYQMRDYEAHNILSNLVNKGICVFKRYEDREAYIFPAFKAKKQVKICEYCGNTYEIREAPHNNCKTCGAPLVITTILV
jgi:rubrerythrin